MYYKPKTVLTPETVYWSQPRCSEYYDPEIHAPYVHYCYTLRRLGKTVRIEECTNLPIDHKEYIEGVEEIPTTPSVLFDFDDY